MTKAFILTALLMLFPFLNCVHAQEITVISATPDSISVVTPSGIPSAADKVNPSSTEASIEMPGWLSILPPLIAILLAIILKEVIISLFAGILTGTVIVALYSPEHSLAAAFFDTITGYILPALMDTGHLSVIVFSLLIGGTVAVISKNGGMAGLVNLISRKATNTMRGQLATWLLGIIIFFDDYANSLVIGTTMRPLTDKLKISREKLSYIVDATAAPVASIAFVTTWIGAQLGYITDGISNIPAIRENAYSVFVHSLPFAYYPVLTIGFMLILILSGRDYGPMLVAEKKARNGEATTGHEGTIELKDFTPEDSTKIRTFNAVIPIIILVGGTIAGLFVTGWDQLVWDNPVLSFIQKTSHIIGQADSYKALLWSSLLALTVACLMSSAQKILSMTKSMEVTFRGFGFMLNAISILVLAWALSNVTRDLHTANFITDTLISLKAKAFLMPALTFIMASLIAFSTGSSWSTMAILYPIVLPASWLVGEQEFLSNEENLRIFYNVVSCVLSGAVLGDHCSPISDTTVLSSLASSCNHIQHVRTQMPYALSVGLISLFGGTIPASVGIDSWILFIIGFVLIYLVIRFIGKRY